MGTATRPAQTSPASWDTFSDVDAFVDAVVTELAAMAADDARPMRSGPKPALTGAPLRKTVMALWCVCFCGMQWRAIGQLCEIPFGTLFTLFGCWTRLGLWRRRLDRLRRTWRLACGDTANTIFEQTKEHLVAFIEIAFVSILARCLKRLVSEEISA